MLALPTESDDVRQDRPTEWTATQTWSVHLAHYRVCGVADSFALTRLNFELAVSVDNVFRFRNGPEHI